MKRIQRRWLFSLLTITGITIGLMANTGCNNDRSSKPIADSLQVKETITGLASFYGRGFEGKETASGKIFDSDDMVAAHPTYPMGTKVRVTNQENQSMVILKIIDRGPTDENVREGVIIDVSKGAAKKLGMVADGRVRIQLEVLQWGENK
jgi:rare lipoprotein A